MSIVMNLQTSKYGLIQDKPLSLLSILKLVIAISLPLLLGSTANAVMNNSLISTTGYLPYELPKSVQQHCLEQQNCPEIEIKVLNTNQEWINKIVNKRIRELAINSTAHETTPNSNTLGVSLNNALDNFAAESIELPKDVPWSYQLMITPTYLGHVSDFELFEIDSYVFTGGAHGMPYSEYLIFDRTTKAQVGLDEMLQTGQAANFEALVYQAYKDWIKTLNDDSENYEKRWPFVLSKNATLTDKGLDIRYQHYEIAPYAYGMPVLHIPYDRLPGIIKPHFVPNKAKDSNKIFFPHD